MRHFALNLFTTVLALSVVSAAFAADQVQWAPDFEQALAAAKQQNKLLLIHFWTPDCGPCKVVDRKVFPSPAVARVINENFIPLKVNAYQRSDLRIHFGVEQWPTDIVSTVDGRALQRMVTPQDPLQYTNVLTSISSQFAPMPQMQPSRMAQDSSAGTQQEWASNIQAPDIADSGARARRPGVDPAMRPGVGVSMPGPDYPADPVSQFGQGSNEIALDREFATRFDRTALTSNLGSNVAASNSAAVSPREFTNRFVNPAPSESASAGATFAQAGNVTNRQLAQAGPRATMPTGSPQTLQQVATPQSSQPSAGLHVSAPQNSAAQQFATTPPQVQQPMPDSQGVAPVQESPQIGLDGRCPVTLVAEGKWRQGDVRWGAIHRGKTYLFAGPQQQQAFLADPDLYSPVLAGMDVVRLAENGSVVQGTRRFGVLFDDDGETGPRKSRIYLFDSVDSRNRFEAEPDRFLQPVMQAMQRGSLETLLR